MDPLTFLGGYVLLTIGAYVLGLHFGWQVAAGVWCVASGAAVLASSLRHVEAVTPAGGDAPVRRRERVDPS